MNDQLRQLLTECIQELCERHRVELQGMFVERADEAGLLPKNARVDIDQQPSVIDNLYDLLNETQ